MVVEKNFSSPSMLLPPVNDNETTPIVTLLETLTSKRATWVKGRVEINPRQEKFWYPSCPYCQKPNDFIMTWGIICEFCKVEICIVPLQDRNTILTSNSQI
ncbi:hypothetical protein ACH5RR_008306 [Cinchona calisaya]|uniref:Uncharacterized protein n=1 Tax=Cinchona calisaya TaxID=153742 RepID=A0ABD3ABE2_9GENT